MGKNIRISNRNTISIINTPRICPAKALEKTNKKFINRFGYLENMSNKLNKPISEMSSSELMKYWDEAKVI